MDGHIPILEVAIKSSRKDVLAGRDTSLDVVRVLAIFLLISLHFLYKTGYYSYVAQTPRMYIMTVMRVGSAICVPLFAMLSGSLLYQKTLSKNYYRGIVKTLCIYILASLLCIVYWACFTGKTYTLWTVITDILGFKAAEYSWYVNMYIGLFLLVPFLNLAYHALQTRKAKRIFIWTLLLVTAAPSVFNGFDLLTPGWWATPAASRDYTKLVPDYWTILWPFTYYFLGAYLREYKVQLNRWWNLALLMLSILLFGTYNYYRTRTAMPFYGPWMEWYGFENLIVTSLVFLFCAQLNTARWPRGIRYGFYIVSESALGMYLVSCIFDHCVYTRLNAAVSAITYRLDYFVPAVLSVFILSFLAAVCLLLLYKGLHALSSAAWQRWKTSRTPVRKTDV